MNASEREMLELFIQESGEHLDSLETDLVALETQPKHATLLNRIFRSVHSVKGTSGFFGFARIGELAHAMESVMALVRDGKMDIDATMMNHFLAATDKLRVMVSNPIDSASVEVAAEVAALKGMLEVRPAPSTPAAPAFEFPDWLKPFALDPELFRAALKHGHNVFVIRLRFKEDMQDKNRTPLDVLNEIYSLGTFFDTYTDINEISGLDDAIEAHLTCVLLFATVMEDTLLRDALDLKESQVQQVSRDFIRGWLATQPTVVPRQIAPPKPPPAPSAPVPADAAPAKSAPPPAGEPAPAADGASAATQPQIEVPGAGARARKDDTVRVAVSLLDDLMNLAGEMVLGRNQLLRLGDTVARDVPGLPGVLQGINRVTSALQGRVMRTRLQPVGGLFGKFPRVIRDLSQKLGKEIQLEMIGEDVELDRTLLEGISDPLTHLIRNSADHGIEDPDTREAAGKPRSGHVRIAATHIGGRVQIEVTDDGRGLDPVRLRAKAVEKGLLRPADAERLTARQAQALIFLPGFSTAAQVSDISGRGVGMDVVKTNIERLGGHVDLDSEPGRGLRVLVRLPLTLAIVPALLVGEGTRRFAVPQVNLEEIVRIDDRRRLEVVRDSWVLRLRGKLLPVGALSAALADQPLPATPPSRGYVLVLKAENHRYGLLVERVLDSEEIVVKPLGRYVKSARVFSGATILGDGRVAMILDTAGVAAASRIGFSDTSAEAEGAERNKGEAQSLLLFNAGGPETFAIHVATVGRIERIRASQIERVGDREFLRYGDGTLRLVRLPNYLPVSASAGDQEQLFVIVPKLVHQPMGLLAASILDTVQTTVNLDTRAVSAAGLLGSAVIKDALTLVIDIYQLLEAVEPGAGRPRDADRLANARILYAEDTAFFRTVVGNYLKEFTGRLDLANDGAEAWERLQRDQYDVLLTDIEMPGLSGFELARKIRSSDRLKDLPIVALSARGNERYLKEGESAGIDHYEVKLDKDRLYAALTDVLSRRPALSTS